MREVLKTIGTWVIGAVVLVCMIGIAYQLGLPIVEGVKEYGVIVVLYAIIAGVFVGGIMFGMPVTMRWSGRKIKSIATKKTQVRGTNDAQSDI